MKYILIILIAMVSSSNCFSQSKKVKTAKTIKATKSAIQDSATAIQVVEVSCGQCQFKMQGNGCDLAVKVNNKAYYVDGTKIDQHGDAHAKDGFCEAIRKAEVKGAVVGDRFKLTYFKLL
jgi:Family of unknown function (DUF6370)